MLRKRLIQGLGTDIDPFVQERGPVVFFLRLRKKRKERMNSHFSISSASMWLVSAILILEVVGENTEVVYLCACVNEKTGRDRYLPALPFL